jgi:hypothetical protein
MYVRWIRRERRPAESWRDSEPDIHWRAILVESVRINGRPTQRHIAYLGGITESAIARSEGPWLGELRQFWEGAMKKLNELSSSRGCTLAQADQDRIVASLAEKVGAPPTASQCRNYDHYRKKQGVERGPSAFYSGPAERRVYGSRAFGERGPYRPTIHAAEAAARRARANSKR